MKREIKNLLDLQIFLQDIPSECKEHPASVVLEDDEIIISHAEVLEETIYTNKKNTKDFGSLEELKEKHGDKFKQQEYHQTHKESRVILSV